MAQQGLVWTDVESSNVNQVAFHEHTNTLCVRFKGGGLYTYKDVDHEIYVSMVHAASVGAYLNEVVKPNYAYERYYSDKELLDELHIEQ